jgi:hypothetical protein
MRPARRTADHRKRGRRATVVLAPVTARAIDDYLAGRETGPLVLTAGDRRS